jgi:O-succinylbenzoic acid--CoA ligase
VNSVWIEGSNYLLDDYISAPAKIRRLNPLEREIITFIVEWISGKDTFELKTSGSTGQPKAVTVQRDQMIASAETTLKYLDVTKGGKALLCLHPRYIAGIMMIVRAIVGELELYVISPSSNPLNNKDLICDYELASFVPYQVLEILGKTTSRNNFKKIKNILIGGADLSEDLIKILRPYENRIYQTFGMTETVSHFALRRISEDAVSELYEVLEGIKIGRDERGCLMVEGRITGHKNVITNDLVDLIDDKRFKWKGRIDQVINTGGIIVNINDLESRIRYILNAQNINNNFMVAGLSDRRLGEKIILLVEKDNQLFSENRIIELLRKNLSKYEIPREIYTLDKFTLLDSGKIDRRSNLKKLKL